MCGCCFLNTTLRVTPTRLKNRCPGADLHRWRSRQGPGPQRRVVSKALSGQKRLATQGVRIGVDPEDKSNLKLILEKNYRGRGKRWEDLLSKGCRRDQRGLPQGEPRP